jgi:hypothetical protein
MNKSEKVVIDRDDLADLVESLEYFMADHEGSKEYRRAQDAMGEAVNQANGSPHYILDLHHEDIKIFLEYSFEEVNDDKVKLAVNNALNSFEEQVRDEVAYHYAEI